MPTTISTRRISEAISESRNERPADRHYEGDGCGEWIDGLYRDYPESDPLGLPEGFDDQEQVEFEEACRLEEERAEAEEAAKHGRCWMC